MGEVVMVTGFTAVLGLGLLGIGLWGAYSGGYDHTLLVFGVNATHNVVHLVSGALALVAALSGARYAKFYCLGFGVAYGATAVAGYAGVTPVVDALHLNAADNALHAGIAALCLWVGSASRGE
jgi:hypothetical protein